MARAYDEMCQLLVPGYDLMQDTLIDFLKFEELEDHVILDLGTGSGILIEKFLNQFPESICHYLDFSDDFMSVAQDRLRKFNEKVIFIKSDFCSDWESKITEKPT